MSSPFRHLPYDKIAESVNEWNLNVELWRKLKKFNWVVSEKIHGANFCVLTDGTRLEFAKRKQILDETDRFFGYSGLIDDLRPKVVEIFTEILKNSQKRIPRQISVYGELFGGSYPHSDVQKLPDVYPVQTGIWYSPSINFVAFDILIFFDDHHEFVDSSEFENLCRNSHLAYTRVLFKGTYEECQKFDIRFNSTLPSLLGLPKLDMENLAEGIVVKMEKSFVHNKVAVRLAIKKKIAEFDEKEDYDSAEKWPKEEKINEIRPLLPFVTENRMMNVLSKFGSIKDLGQGEFDQILQNFIDDVMDAYYMSGNESADSVEVKFIDEMVYKSVLEKLGMDILQKISCRP